MNLNQALAKLRILPTPVIRTNDAAAHWGVSPALASKMLARLAGAGHVSRLQRGIWLTDISASPWTLHPYLTDPSLSYLSLQTALFHHGMIEQIPTTIHVISTVKTRTIKSPLGVYAIHQVAPSFFCGFEPFAGGPAQMATPEKALVDFFYFRPAKSRAFRALPELEIPRGFKIKRAEEFARLIQSAARREMVLAAIKQIFATKPVKRG
jgi:predicted transcriptional regulator of viral defense system